MGDQPRGGYEFDRVEAPDWLQRKVANLKPTAPELLRLLRRRSGYGLHELARKYGVSHVSLLRRERLGDKDLLRFYGIGSITALLTNAEKG
jgi:hypothetical protein